MKPRLRPAATALVLLGLLAGYPATVESQEIIFEEILWADGDFLWKSDGQRHPKSAIRGFLVLEEAFLHETDLYQFCVWYTRCCHPGKRDKGRVTGTVWVIDGNGTTRRVARIKGKVSSDRSLECSAPLSVALELGDAVVWTFEFRKMPRLEEGRTAYFRGTVFKGGPIPPGR